MKTLDVIQKAVKARDYEMAQAETNKLWIRSCRIDRARTAAVFSGGIIFVLTVFMAFCMILYEAVYAGEAVKGAEIFVSICLTLKTVGFSAVNIILIGIAASFCVGGACALIVKNRGKANTLLTENETGYRQIHRIYKRLGDIKNMQGSISSEALLSALQMSIASVAVCAVTSGILMFFTNLPKMHTALAVFAAVLGFVAMSIMLFLPFFIVHIIFYALLFSIFTRNSFSAEELTECRNTVGSCVLDERLAIDPMAYFDVALADDGVPKACLYVGMKKFADMLKMTSYPSFDQRDKCLKMLETAYKSGFSEGEFVYLMAKLRFSREHLKSYHLEEMLTQLSKLRENGTLPEYCLDAYEHLEISIRYQISDRHDKFSENSEEKNSEIYKDISRKYYSMYMGYSVDKSEYALIHGSNDAEKRQKKFELDWINKHFNDIKSNTRK